MLEHTLVDGITIFHTYLNPFAIDANRFHREVHADRVAVSLDIVTRLEALHHARFARATVADQYHLEQEVERVVRRRQLHQRVRIALGHGQA